MKAFSKIRNRNQNIGQSETPGKGQPPTNYRTFVISKLQIDYCWFGNKSCRSTCYFTCKPKSCYLSLLHVKTESIIEYQWNRNIRNQNRTSNNGQTEHLVRSSLQTACLIPRTINRSITKAHHVREHTTTITSNSALTNDGILGRMRKN